MADQELWDRLLTPEVLKRGWHMTRKEIGQDFAEDIHCQNVFALELDLVVRELINRIRTGTYSPQPLLHVEVPKSPLGFRPGTVVSVQDRVILSAIVFLLAPEIDEKLPDGVYSWRLKDPVPRSGDIFKHTTIVDLPFLKRQTISRLLDPFDPWYRTWPDFDQRSRSAFLTGEYRFLATSDIAAYFENIQLPMLRDQLLGHFPNDSALVNLLMSFLESWAYRSEEGRPYLRGIPQGNSVSGFLGNLFLLPLDQAICSLIEKREMLYYRYMDDVRIFAKDLDSARMAVFEMNRTLRSLHLNVQTAKTRILDERKREISNTLIDPRGDRLSEIYRDLHSDYGDRPIPKERSKEIIRKVDELAKQRPGKRQPLLGARRPLEGLDLRAFKQWLSCHCRLGSTARLPNLLREIQRNPDHRLTRKLVVYAKRFPRARSIETSLLEFMRSERCIFPHQRAECLRAIRYLSRVSPECIRYCRELLYSPLRTPYERVQAAYLLSRTELTPMTLAKCMRMFEKEPDPFVQVAIAGLLVQRRERNDEVVRALVFHPNNRIRDLGKYFRCIKNDRPTVRNTLDHLFRAEAQWLICDGLPLIHLMAASKKIAVRVLLADRLGSDQSSIPHVGIRELVSNVQRRVEQSLATIES